MKFLEPGESWCCRRSGCPPLLRPLLDIYSVVLTGFCPSRVTSMILYLLPILYFLPTVITKFSAFWGSGNVLCRYTQQMEKSSQYCIL